MASIVTALIDAIKGKLVPNEPTGDGVDGSVAPKTIGGDVVISGEDSPGFSMGDDTAREINDIISNVVKETDTVHRWSIRRVRKAREYFIGRQDVVLDPQTNSYVPTDTVNTAAVGLDSEDEDLDPIYSWNIFQATGSYIVGILAGSPPTTKFYPKDADKAADVQTAKAANDIIELFHRTNNIDTLIQDEARLLYTDGFWAAYVRHVEDGQRFGFKEVPVYTPKQVMTLPARYVRNVRTDDPVCDGPVATPSPSVQLPKV